MQKRLADYFKTLVDHKHDLKEFYESDALLLSDEVSIITGLLVGLNVLDLNFCLKEALLDYPSETSIYYHLYLRERRIPLESSSAMEDPIDELDDYSSLSSSPPLMKNGDANVTTTPDDAITIDDQRISTIIDQKNYIEELYRNLQ